MPVFQSLTFTRQKNLPHFSHCPSFNRTSWKSDVWSVSKRHLSPDSSACKWVRKQLREAKDNQNRNEKKRGLKINLYHCIMTVIRSYFLSPTRSNGSKLWVVKAAVNTSPNLLSVEVSDSWEFLRNAGILYSCFKILVFWEVFFFYCSTSTFTVAVAIIRRAEQTLAAMFAECWGCCFFYVWGM